MNITKTQSQSIKGGAVILMIAHHLFYYPSKEYAALISGIPCEHALGIFGKICVPMFLIVSGYGLSVKGDFSYGSMMRKIYAFLKIYWFYSSLADFYLLGISHGLELIKPFIALMPSISSRTPWELHPFIMARGGLSVAISCAFYCFQFCIN